MTSNALSGRGTKDAPQYMNRKSFCQSKIRHLDRNYARFPERSIRALKITASSFGKR